MNKKEILRHRPLDEVDVYELQQYIETDFKDFYSNMYNYGVINGLNVAATTGMTVVVNAGRALDSLYNLIKVSTVQNVIIDASNTSPRIDVISIKFKTVNIANVDTENKYGKGTSFVYSYDILDAYEIQVTKGTPSSSPLAPLHPAGNLKLAEVYVTANTTTIFAGNIIEGRVMASIKGITSKSIEIVDEESGFTATNVEDALAELNGSKLNANGGYINNGTGNTPATTDNSNRLATTAYVKSNLLDLNVSRRAQADDVPITSTSETTIATYAPTAGNYFVGIYLRVLSTVTLTVRILYTDNTGAQTVSLITAQSTVAGSYSLIPYFLNAVASGTITVRITSSVANQVEASATILGV